MENEYNTKDIKFRRSTIETVNLAEGRLITWYVFKFTSPAEMKGAYGAVDGVWRWQTRTERDDALRIMKRQCGQAT